MGSRPVVQRIAMTQQNDNRSSKRKGLQDQVGERIYGVFDNHGRPSISVPRHTRLLDNINGRGMQGANPLKAQPMAAIVPWHALWLLRAKTLLCVSHHLFHKTVSLKPATTAMRFYVSWAKRFCSWWSECKTRTLWFRNELKFLGRYEKGGIRHNRKT